MVTVNMLEAKTNLSKLVEVLESGTEEEIVIARNGRPAARLMPMGSGCASSIVGIAKGQFFFDKGEFDAMDEEIATMFGIPPMKELLTDETAA